MARFNFDVWGSAVWGPGTPVPFLADPVAGATKPSGALGVQARVFDANTIQVLWSPYDDPTLTTMRLVRSTVGPPAWEQDGDVLLDAPQGEATRWVDTGLQSNTYYYYTVFSFDTKTQSWLRGGSAECITPNDAFDMGTFLYRRLPQWYHDLDSQQQIIGDGPLQRFLALIGFELDIMRTELESVADIWDPVKGAAQMVPYALGQFLMDPEPELGYANQRQLLRAAAILYVTKGSANCVRTLCQAVTGWATTVESGLNLVSSNLDAQFDGTIGHWLSVNATAVWRAGDGVINAPNGVGMAVLTATGSGNPAMTLYADDPQYSAVPVIQGQVYGVSVLARGSAGDAVSIGVRFWDVHGVAIGPVITGSSVVPDPSDWNQQAKVVVTAPVNAWSMSLVVSTNGTVSGHITYLSSVMVQPLSSSSAAFAAYQPARDVRVVVSADQINEVVNPKFAVDTNSWLTTIGADVTVAGGTLTRITTAEPPPVSSGTSGHLVTTAANQGTYTRCSEVSAGTYYTQGVWIYVVSGAGVKVVVRDVASGATYISPNVVTVGAWSAVNLPFVSDDGAFEIDISLVALGVTTVNFGAVMLTQGGPDEVAYFDGDIASSTDDYMWEGQGNASRSHYYRQRTLRSYRFRELLPRFLMTGQTATMLFAQPPILPALYPDDALYPSDDLYPSG